MSDAKVIVHPTAGLERVRRRQWARIQAALSRHRRRPESLSRCGVLVTATVVLAVGAYSLVSRIAYAEPLRVASGSSFLDLELTDGSRLKLAPASRVRVIDTGTANVEFEIEEGSAWRELPRANGSSDRHPSR